MIKNDPDSIAPSGRTNPEEIKNVSPKHISLPKVSPFAKSIPIKKHSIKLFSEEDEHLMSCFKTMCGASQATNVRHCRLSKKDLKKYLAKRYHTKIAETVVNTF